jgi:short-chain Z-isoprenyl diphosphate synthase
VLPGLVQRVVYGIYTHRLRKQLVGADLPEHIGIIMDGNRRWARRMGMADPSVGHKYGAEHVETVLSWCERAGVKHVTVYLCSTENLARRDDAEVSYLMQLIEQVITDKLAQPGAGWQVHVAGTLDALPDTTAHALKNAVEVTRECRTGHHITLAIGYGGRQEVVDALRALLTEHAAAGTLDELADTITMEDVSRHLYTAGQPDPDLVIRTSGEQRLSNFLVWQSAYSELYFCDTFWPAFREVDFLRALRSSARRNRRYGG